MLQGTMTDSSSHCIVEVLESRHGMGDLEIFVLRKCWLECELCHKAKSDIDITLKGV